MNFLKKFPSPKIRPILDKEFYPASVFHKFYNENIVNNSKNKCVIKIFLERENNYISYYECYINNNSTFDDINNFYLERIIKFLLSQKGGYKIYILAPQLIYDYLKKEYNIQGRRSFDVQFMSEKVYEKVFEIIPCNENSIKHSKEVVEKVDYNSDGFRIGIDLGASDIKVCAILNGHILISEEIIWTPKEYSDFNYHRSFIKKAIERCLELKSDRQIDTIGVSSAGVIVNNRPMVSNLFRSVDSKFKDDVKNIFIDISKEYNVPIIVKNDGDVAALAASRILGKGKVLAIALGSSQAGGYVNAVKGFNKGWLNELAFVPIDYSPKAALEEWSLDIGCGASYLSQQCIFRLAKQYKFDSPPGLVDAKKLEFYQEKLEQGYQLALDLWQTMGCYLGYAIAHYVNFYDISDVVILGRCASFKGGEILKQTSEEVLKTEFKDTKVAKIQVHLPDEKFRRLGQAEVAATLSVN